MVISLLDDTRIALPAKANPLDSRHDDGARTRSWQSGAHAKLESLMAELKAFDELFGGSLNKLQDDSITLNNASLVLARDQDDTDMLDLAGPDLESLRERAEELRWSVWYSEPVYHNSAYVAIRAGAGGTESCD